MVYFINKKKLSDFVFVHTFSEIRWHNIELVEKKHRFSIFMYNQIQLFTCRLYISKFSTYFKTTLNIFYIRVRFRKLTRMELFIFKMKKKI